jgi:hypothetical protein
MGSLTETRQFRTPRGWTAQQCPQTITKQPGHISQWPTVGWTTGIQFPARIRIFPFVIKSRQVRLSPHFMTHFWNAYTLLVIMLPLCGQARGRGDARGVDVRSRRSQTSAHANNHLRTPYDSRLGCCSPGDWIATFLPLPASEPRPPSPRSVSHFTDRAVSTDLLRHDSTRTKKTRHSASNSAEYAGYLCTLSHANAHCHCWKQRLKISNKTQCNLHLHSFRIKCIKVG